MIKEVKCLKFTVQKEKKGGWMNDGIDPWREDQEGGGDNSRSQTNGRFERRGLWC